MHGLLFDAPSSPTIVSDWAVGVLGLEPSVLMTQVLGPIPVRSHAETVVVWSAVSCLHGYPSWVGISEYRPYVFQDDMRYRRFAFTPKPKTRAVCHFPANASPARTSYLLPQHDHDFWRAIMGLIAELLISLCGGMRGRKVFILERG